MKLLIITLTVFFASSSFAVIFGDLAEPKLKSVIGYSEPEVHGIELIKEKSGIVVKTEFLLSGCLNELTPMTQTIVKTETDLIVILSALEVEIHDSNNVKCIQANIQEAKLFVPVEEAVLANFGDSIKIQFAKSNQTFQLMNEDF